MFLDIHTDGAGYNLYYHIKQELTPVSLSIDPMH